MTLEGLGHAQQGLGRFDEAEHNFQRSLDIRLSASGPDDSDLAQSHRDLGELLLETRKQFTRARAHYAEALRIDEIVFGKTSVKLVADLKGVGRTEVALRQFAMAIQTLERAFQLARDGNVEDQTLAAIHFALARALWTAAAIARERASWRRPHTTLRRGRSLPTRRKISC